MLWGVPPDLDTTRAYVSGSLWSGFGKGDGEFSDGPYGIQEPAAFFSPDFYPWAFNPEASSHPCMCYILTGTCMLFCSSHNFKESPR